MNSPNEVTSLFPKLLTVEQMAGQLNVSVKRGYEMISRGILPQEAVVRLGRQIGTGFHQRLGQFHALVAGALLDFIPAHGRPRHPEAGLHCDLGGQALEIRLGVEQPWIRRHVGAG